MITNHTIRTSLNYTTYHAHQRKSMQQKQMAHEDTRLHTMNMNLRVQKNYEMNFSQAVKLVR